MNPADIMKMLPCVPGANGSGNPFESIMKMLPCMPGTMGSSGNGGHMNPGGDGVSRENPIANILSMVQSYCGMIPMLMSLMQGFTGMGSPGGLFSPQAPSTSQEEDDDTIEITDDTFSALEKLDDLKDVLNDIATFKDEIREIIDIAKTTRAKNARRTQSGGA